MKRLAAVLAVLALVAAASLVLGSAAPAGPAAKKFRLNFETKEGGVAAQGGTFLLIPSLPSPLLADSGTFTFTMSQSPRAITRDGQGVTVYVAKSTYKGKRGTLVIRDRIEDVTAGNGYHVGTGTWSLVSGTGAYAGLSGGGRHAGVLTPAGRIFIRYEGLVSQG